MGARKGFLFAIIVLVSFSLRVDTVEAAVAQNEVPLISGYDYKSDPFLLEWSFSLDKKSGSPEVVVTEQSREEKILARWKEKQDLLWKNLPTDSFIINASAYTAAADECGKSDGVTSSGLKVQEKRTLACPPNLPFGSKIAIEGMGEYRCEDRGGAIKGNHIDIYVQTKSEAFAFGRRNLTAQVIQ